MMAELFEVEVNTINYHLKEIFNSGELLEKATIRKIRIVRKEGHKDIARQVEFYNLDALFSKISDFFAIVFFRQRKEKKKIQARKYCKYLSPLDV